LKKQRKITLVVGKTGYGKSFIVKDAINRLDRVVIFDTLGEYNNYEDFTVVTTLKDLHKELLQKYEDTYMQIICRYTEQEQYETALAMCYMVGNLTVVIEEISNFSNAHALSPILEKIVRFGRHRDMSIIGITQRFSDIGLLLRNNLDMLVCFNLTAPNDINYLREIEFIGDNADSVPKLKRYQFLVFTNYN